MFVYIHLSHVSSNLFISLLPNMPQSRNYALQSMMKTVKNENTQHKAQTIAIDVKNAIYSSK